MFNRHISKVGKGCPKHICLAMVEIFVKNHCHIYCVQKCAKCTTYLYDIKMVLPKREPCGQGAHV
jgi:hypothetical protein